MASHKVFFLIYTVHRSKVWKILLKYTSTNKDNHEQSLFSKRKDYFHLVNSYIDNPIIESDQQDKKATKLIHDDVIRTLPSSPLFRENIIQQMLERYFLIYSESFMYGTFVIHPVDTFKA